MLNGGPFSAAGGRFSEALSMAERQMAAMGRVPVATIGYRFSADARACGQHRLRRGNGMARPRVLGAVDVPCGGGRDEVNGGGEGRGVMTRSP